MKKVNGNVLGMIFCVLFALPVSVTAQNYQQNITSTANWILSIQLKDGAILYNPGGDPEVIEPYFANLGAIGLTRTKDSTYYPAVQEWITWYVDHLNTAKSDTRWQLACTIYDYDVSGNSETSTGNADSTDSYAATFVSLVQAYWLTGSAAHTWLKANLTASQLDCVGKVMVATQKSNGLTWATPTYPTQYLMDNSEVYRGFTDLASLLSAVEFNDTSRSSYYSGRATLVKNGIQNVLWDSANNDYQWYAPAGGGTNPPPCTGASETNWACWYPDSVAQLYPILNEVIKPSSSNATAVYDMFNTSWPGWTTLGPQDQNGGFPWVNVSGAAALMGGTSDVNSYIDSIQSAYVNNGFPWPWYCLEAGWFIRVNNYMLHGGTL
jgi:hypothetical protein